MVWPEAAFAGRNKAVEEANMTARKAITAAVATAFLAAAGSALGGPDDVQTWTFDKKEAVKLNTVSGDCRVEKSEDGKIEIELASDFRPERTFRPKVSERSGVIKLSEKMTGSNSGVLSVVKTFLL